LIVPETSSAVVGFFVPMPTFPDESMSIELPAALLNTKTLDPGVIPVAVGGIAWMLPTTVKFAKRLLHIRPVKDDEFYSRGNYGVLLGEMLLVIRNISREALMTISSLFAGMLWIVGSAIILATSLVTISSYAT
jgi:hypothetical protein